MDRVGNQSESVFKALVGTGWLNDASPPLAEAQRVERGPTTTAPEAARGSLPRRRSGLRSSSGSPTRVSRNKRAKPRFRVIAVNLQQFEPVGLSVKETGGGLVIADVVLGGAAARAGIVAGQLLVSVNGEMAISMNPARFMAIISTADPIVTFVIVHITESRSRSRPGPPEAALSNRAPTDSDVPTNLGSAVIGSRASVDCVAPPSVPEPQTRGKPQIPGNADALPESPGGALAATREWPALLDLSGGSMPPAPFRELGPNFLLPAVPAPAVPAPTP